MNAGAIPRDHWTQDAEAGGGRIVGEASHFIDNPASGRVLEKLEFVPTGMSAERYSCARGGEAIARIYRLSLMGRADVEAPLAA